MHSDPLVALYKFDIKFTKDKDDLVGWRQNIETIKMVDEQNEGVQYLKDIRKIEQAFGVSDTYSTLKEF